VQRLGQLRYALDELLEIAVDLDVDRLDGLLVVFALVRGCLGVGRRIAGGALGLPRLPRGQRGSQERQQRQRDGLGVVPGQRRGGGGHHHRPIWVAMMDPW
jgi:hypothetical protein